MKPKVLVSDPLPAEALVALQGIAEIDTVSGLTPAQLAEKVKPYQALIVRSASLTSKSTSSKPRPTAIISTTDAV